MIIIPRVEEDFAKGMLYRSELKGPLRSTCTEERSESAGFGWSKTSAAFSRSHRWNYPLDLELSQIFPAAFSA